jgi:hypothetical protein
MTGKGFRMEEALAIDLDTFASGNVSRSGLQNDTMVAPARRDPMPPNVERADELSDLDDDEFDVSRPVATEATFSGDLTEAAIDYALYVGLNNIRPNIEGASFMRLAEDVFVIPVRGAQPLHHDRHLASLPDDIGANEHTWNYCIEGGDSQNLLCEVEPGIFQHFPLVAGAWIYMNSANRHAISRSKRSDSCVIVQVCGYTPEQRELAVARIVEVLEARPKAAQV